MPLDLANPDRKVHVGIILMGETEILDVAPIDFLHSLSPKFINILPISDELKAKALDMEFHWITEKGDAAKLTAGISLNATVRCLTIPRNEDKCIDGVNTYTRDTQDSYDSCPPLDIVLMGAYFPNYTPNDADLAFIRKAYNECACPPLAQSQLTPNPHRYRFPNHLRRHIPRAARRGPHLPHGHRPALYGAYADAAGSTHDVGREARAP
jgi:hypothetical protein